MAETEGRETELGLLVVVTGPSGAGKDMVMNKLLERFAEMKRVVTYTSRPLNEARGEVDGVDYHFVTDAEFQKMRAEGKFLESVPYGEHFKGTTKGVVEQVLTGVDVIWRIDMSRAAGVEELFENAFDRQTAAALLARTVVIAIVPDRVETLRQRWNEGRRGDKGEFNRRMRQDARVWRESKGKFDYVLVNRDGKQEETVERVAEIIENL